MNMTTAQAAPKAPLDILKYFPEIGQIEDRSLREAVVSIWQKLWADSTWQRLEDVPASTETAYPNWLHNQAVMAMMIAIADIFERVHGLKVDRDVLIACAALQDASKLVEFSAEKPGSLTEIGRNYPHAFYVAHLGLEHKLPPKIIHILLTHTPQSIRFPEYIEGKILYYADQLDVIAIFKDRWRKETFITK